MLLDFLSIAIAELGSISERRVYQLISGIRNLPAFLVAKPGLNSGFMIPQYTAASIVSQNKQLCTPASIDSIVSSNGQEDHVSMGTIAARKAMSIMENTRKVIAMEIFTACQAIDLKKAHNLGKNTSKAYKKVREYIPFIDNDVIMYPHIHTMEDLIVSDELFDFVFET